MSDPRPAARLSEIASGEMKEVTVGETPVLLARVGDECFAVAAHCTHYAAPLVEGVLVGDKIICPWHHACFNVRNGDVLEPPAFDSLERYETRIDGDNIFVSVPEGAPDRHEPTMAGPDDAVEGPVYVIIGGGASGYIAAQTLREDGFTGRITMVTREDHLPYDRPNLSKDYLQGNAEPAWMPLRDDEFYTRYGIEVVFNKEVIDLDTARKTVRFADGGELEYDRLMVATGGVARKLEIPGADLRHVFLLRSFDSADAIIEGAAAAKKAVVVGAGFIGMEAACSLTQRGINVTVVTPDRTPFEHILGPEVGRMFERLHRQNGVNFRFRSHAVALEGDGKVRSVRLDTGESLDADLVLVGIGAQPETSFLHGLELHRDGGVVVDEHMCVAPDVYAAGDITHFPDPRTGEPIRIEHWRTALQQGRTAAHNMCGHRDRFQAVPFFWTEQFGVRLNYLGHANDWSETIVHGDIAKMDFLAFYIKDFKVMAVAGVNRDREMAFFEELIRLNRMPSLAELRKGSADSSVMVREAGASYLPATSL